MSLNGKRIGSEVNVPNQAHQSLSDGNGQCVIVSRRVQDVEEFSQAFSGFGFSMTRLSAEQGEGEFLAIRMDGLQLIRIKSNCTMYTTGTKASDGIGFSTPLVSPEGKVVW